MNSWSSFSYLVLGFLIMAIAIKDLGIPPHIRSKIMPNHFRKNPQWMLFTGFFLALTGFGSFAYHSSFLEFALFCDKKGVILFLKYRVCFLSLNIMLEDLNRITRLGDVVSFVLAPACVMFCLITEASLQ
jgi:hypothetical protein